MQMQWLIHSWFLAYRMHVLVRVHIYARTHTHIRILNSEGFPRTGYFAPGRDGTRAWQISGVARASRALLPFCLLRFRCFTKVVGGVRARDILCARRRAPAVYSSVW